MDATQLGGWRLVLQMKKDEYAAKQANNTFESAEALQRSLQEIRDAEDTVKDFITVTPNKSNIDGWVEASKAIIDVWDALEPQKVEVLLPKFVSSQAWKRRHVETRDFLGVSACLQVL